MSTTPATCQPPPLVSAPRAACLRLPPFPDSIRLPFSALGLHPGPCQTLGGSPIVRNSVSVCLRFSLPMYIPMYWHIMVFGFCQVVFLMWGQEAMAPPLPGSQSSRSFPPPPPPPPASTLPNPLFVYIPSYRSKFVGDSHDVADITSQDDNVIVAGKTSYFTSSNYWENILGKIW